MLLPGGITLCFHLAILLLANLRKAILYLLSAFSLTY